MTERPKPHQFDAILTSKLLVLEEMVAYLISQQARAGGADVMSMRKWADDYVVARQLTLSGPEGSMFTKTLSEFLDGVVENVRRSQAG